MILSDSALQDAMAAGELVVDGFHDSSLQPASIDLHLGQHFAWWDTCNETIDLANHHTDFPCMWRAQQSAHCLRPGGFVLATTSERIEIGTGLVGRVEGRSSLGRVGLVVHATAGFIDPGFRGQITLELYNQSPHRINVVAGQGICQLAVERVFGEVRQPYGDAALRSKYLDQVGVTTSRWKGTNVG